MVGGREQALTDSMCCMHRIRCAGFCVILGGRMEKNIGRYICLVICCETSFIMQGSAMLREAVEAARKKELAWGSRGGWLEAGVNELCECKTTRSEAEPISG